MSYWAESLDTFIACRQLNHRDLPDVWPDDDPKPAMEPVRADWTWIERLSLEKLPGNELQAIFEQLSCHNGCFGLKDIIRKRLDSLKIRRRGFKINRSKMRKGPRLPPNTRRWTRRTPPPPLPEPEPPAPEPVPPMTDLATVQAQIQLLISDPIDRRFA